MLFKINKQGDYALLFMLALTLHYTTKAWISVATVSSDNNLSPHFLSNIVQKLRKARLVISCEGLGGGYRLAQSPDTITAGAVLRAVFCDTSVKQKKSPTPSAWGIVDDAIGSTLDTITLVDLIKRYAASMRK